MTRLIDTNVLIHAQRGRPASVRTRLREISPDDLAISSVTVAELWYGAARSAEPDLKRRLWSRVLEPYEVLPFDRDAAERHGELRFALRHRPIGERDLLIAAIALAGDLILVTDNAGELARVPGLRLESWVE
jgi:tRNA(fMet)-specific endonuclease VapC